MITAVLFEHDCVCSRRRCRISVTLVETGIVKGVVFERGTNKPPRSQSTLSHRIFVTFSVRMPVNNAAIWRSRRIGFVIAVLDRG